MEGQADSAEDRRLWRLMRLALLAAVLVCAGVLAANWLGTSQILSRYERKAASLVSLERAELMAQRLESAALRYTRAATPGERIAAQAEIGEAARGFRAALDTAMAVDADHDPRVAVVLERPPHRLSEALARLATLEARLRGSTGSAPAREAASALHRLAERRLAHGVHALAVGKRATTRQVRRSMADRAAVIAAIALGLCLAQWYLVFRPLLGLLSARTAALRSARDQVERSRLHDALTGLPNRRRLIEALEARGTGARLGILHVDLGGLEEINSTLGWDVGEQIIRYAAKVLGTIAPARDIVARTDSGEFVLAISERTDPDQLRDLAEEIIRALSQPVELDANTFTLEVVIGIAMRSALAETPERLLTNAAIARTLAREEGGPAYFSIGMEERLAARRQTAQELLNALVADELEPYFQPQIDARTGRLTGFEALVRWRHPTRGLLNPHFFLDIADHAHLGQRITAIMLSKSIRALAEWRRQGHAVPRIGLNFTARELRNPALQDHLLFDLDRAGLEPADISIEILESALIEEEDDPILANIAALSATGFHIDLDDFGTGHASLSYLRHLTVDRLKIDRSFVRDLHLRPELRKMTHAMIQLAKALDIAALAEGIETEAEWRMLIEMGCDDLQGFAIGKPMPGAAVAGWLETHARRLSAGRVIAAA